MNKRPGPVVMLGIIVVLFALDILESVIDRIRAAADPAPLSTDTKGE